jgi:lipoprotein-anchoring transpeptidase ErfK/SrfK
MRRLVAAGALALACGFHVEPAAANLVIHIDKSSQRMSVAVDGATRYVWPVSTGRAGYGTPSGTFRPQRLARTWFSKKYYNSPMPYSIFFHHGFAIHGSYEIRRLGGPASHGCVRLHPGNAATLFRLVQQEGTGATRIVVSGSNPAPRYRARRYDDIEPQYPPVWPFFAN